MSDSKVVKDVMIGIFEYPHVPYWFTINQAIKIVKASFISAKKYPDPLAVLVFDEKYNLMGTITLKDILRGMEPRFLKASEKAQGLRGRRIHTVTDLGHALRQEFKSPC